MVERHWQWFLVLVLFSFGRYSSPTGPDESRVWGGWVGCVKVGLDGNYLIYFHDMLRSCSLLYSAECSRASHSISSIFSHGLWHEIALITNHLYLTYSRSSWFGPWSTTTHIIVNDQITNMYFCCRLQNSRTKISGAYWDDERKLKFANGTRKTTVNPELLQYGQRTQDNHSSN